MSNVSIADPEALVGMFEELALRDAGPAFNAYDLDEFEVGREFGSMRLRTSSHNQFGAQRKLDEQTGQVLDVDYYVHQGTTTCISAFPDEVFMYSDLQADEIGDAAVLELSDCSSYVVSAEDGDIEIARLRSYVYGGEIVCVAAFASDREVFGDPDMETLQAQKKTMPSGIVVIEYVVPGAEAVTPVDDMFNQITSSFGETKDRDQIAIDHMLEIIQIVKHGY